VIKGYYRAEKFFLVFRILLYTSGGNGTGFFDF
jgi:hypothetical protein